MSKCPNCNTKITCGCQRATAVDGKSACSKCVGAYNKKLQGATAPKTSTAPSNVTVKYSGPGKQV